ncbi:MAG: fibronectin type III domain-containing protein [Phycisphaerae bacterium]
MKTRTPSAPLLHLFLSLLLAACSSSPPAKPPLTSPIHLTATLTSPTDVRLHWTDPDPRAAGYAVEYADQPNGNFITLAFLPAGENSFTHPTLLPEAHFFYRVRPYYGEPSAPAEVELPAALTNREFADRYAKTEDYSWGAPKSLPTPNAPPPASLRTNPAAATPADLHAQLVPSTVSGIQLTWIDRSSDEDGFLLESRTGGDPHFQVCALLAPNTNAFGWSLAPPDRAAAFRIRAFYLGQTSNIDAITTGKAAAPATQPR